MSQSHTVGMSCLCILGVYLSLYLFRTTPMSVGFTSIPAGYRESQIITTRTPLENTVFAPVIFAERFINERLHIQMRENKNRPR
jgi:hypothetical protein